MTWVLISTSPLFEKRIFKNSSQSRKTRKFADDTLCVWMYLFKLGIYNTLLNSDLFTFCSADKTLLNHISLHLTTLFSLNNAENPHNQDQRICLHSLPPWKYLLFLLYHFSAGKASWIAQKQTDAFWGDFKKARDKA